MKYRIAQFFSVATVATVATVAAAALMAVSAVHAQAQKKPAAEKKAAAEAPKPAADAAKPAAGDAAEAHKKIAMCEGCHGIPGYKTAYPVVYHVPKLGGQTAPYLVAALNAYKNGQRQHPSMKGVAASLTDADIANIAAYYSSAKGGH